MEITDIFGKPTLPEFFKAGQLYISGKIYEMYDIYLFKKKHFESIYRIKDGYPVNLIESGFSVSGYGKFVSREFLATHHPLHMGKIILPFVENFSSYQLDNVAIENTNSNFHENIIRFKTSSIKFIFNENVV